MKKKAVSTPLRGVVLSGLTATAALALPGTSYERAELFATCAGRMAALATSQRALNHPETGSTEQVREDFDMMLDATLPAALSQGVPPNEPRLWRSSGWSEIASLLADAQYSFDLRRAERAQDALEARIRDCRAILLPAD